jgi:hypothetical protein
MFPRPESRFKTAFRRSLDAAIDFATLGEYGYAPAWDDAGTDGASDADWGFDGAWASPDGAATGVGTAVAAPPTQRGAATTAALVPPATAAAIAAPPTQRGAATTAALVPPATAAARALRNAERRAEPVCAGQPTRARELSRQLPRVARQRDGMAPREQHCAADAG